MAVVGAPAALMVPAAGGIADLPVWLSLGCFLVAAGPTVGRPYRDGRRAGADPLGERPAVAVLLFVGLGLFALFAAWGPPLARAADLPAALRRLALPVVLAGSVVVLAGLVVQQRVTEPAGLRATGTAVALAGMVILFASLVLAWPDPVTLRRGGPAGRHRARRPGFLHRLPWLYAGAIPCLALVPVVLQVGSAAGRGRSGRVAGRGDRGGPERGGAGRGRPGAGRGGGGGGSLPATGGRPGPRPRGGRRGGDRALDRHRPRDRGAGVRGGHAPRLAAGFVAAGFRWRYRVVRQAGVWLVLLASLWTLWATRPDRRACWGLTDWRWRHWPWRSSRRSGRRLTERSPVRDGLPRRGRGGRDPGPVLTATAAGFPSRRPTRGRYSRWRRRARARRACTGCGVHLGWFADGTGGLAHLFASPGDFEPGRRGGAVGAPGPRDVGDHGGRLVSPSAPASGERG